MTSADLSSDVVEMAGGDDSHSNNRLSLSDSVETAEDSSSAAEESSSSSNRDQSSNWVEAANRYFVIKIESSDELGNEKSLLVSRELKEAISNALKMSSVTVIVGSTTAQCFIGYAVVLKDEMTADAPETVESTSIQYYTIPIKWMKLCYLSFGDAIGIKNAFNDGKSITQISSGQVIKLLFFENNY